MRLLPLNVQSFRRMREDDNIYVDKTALIHRLAQNKNNFFLSRPRRFGKSLLCSTLKCYFEGRRELFRGLAIDALETEWKRYPVLHLDFNSNNYQLGIGVLDDLIDRALGAMAAAYGITLTSASQGGRFGELLLKVHESTGMPVVLLFDEYDKPLLETIMDETLHEQTRNVMRAFYGNLKTASDHIRFALLTGVTKFPRLSIFSDLNNITDISLNPDYATILGITEAELHECFDDHIARLAGDMGLSKEEAYGQMRNLYDGYHFAWPSEGVYNPYSVLNCLNDRRFNHYWSETALPYHVARLLSEGTYDTTKLADGVRATPAKMGQLETSGVPIGMMYQSGYLTIKDYNFRTNYYTLAFPNEEVRSSFLDYLLPQYINKDEALLGDEYALLKEETISGDVAAMMPRLRRIMAGIPCATTDPQLLELHYRNIVYLIMSPLGFGVQCERAVLAGVIDLVVHTDDIIYIFEFKRGEALQRAADQIVRKDYAAPWLGGTKRVIAVAVAIDDATRNISGWKVVDL